MIINNISIIFIIIDFNNYKYITFIKIINKIGYIILIFLTL